MSGVSLIPLVFAALAVLFTAALFMLYQNPMMEIYLADWALC